MEMGDIFMGLLLIALVAGVYFGIKRKWKNLGISVIVLIISFIGFGITYEEEIEAEESDTEEVVKDEEVEVEEEPEEIVKEEKKAEPEPEEPKDEKQKESNLPEELEDLRVTDVRDDVTGNWRIVVDSKNFNMPENAVSYSEEYINEDEIHFLVSFATNTTTQINKYGEILYVDIYEYEEKEEHSANSLGGGMLLKSYQVNERTGEIIDLDD